MAICTFGAKSFSVVLGISRRPKLQHETGGSAFELRWGDILVESKLEEPAKKRRAAGAREAACSAGSTNLIFPDCPNRVPVYWNGEPKKVEGRNAEVRRTVAGKLAFRIIPY